MCLVCINELCRRDVVTNVKVQLGLHQLIKGMVIA
jgi:hypothetical protein